MEHYFFSQEAQKEKEREENLVDKDIFFSLLSYVMF